MASMRSIAQLLAEARARGIRVHCNDDKLRVEGASFHDDLIHELIARKQELLRLLKLEEKIMRMPLSEFKKRGFILRLHSEVCGEIWFVSHEGLLKQLHPLEGKAVFTGEELEALLQAEPTDRDLQVAATAKRTFPLAKLKTEHH